MFGKLWSWLSSPLKSFAKSLALAAIQKEGAVLRDNFKAVVQRDGPGEVDHLFDAFQAKLEAAAMGLPFLPDPLKTQICGIIQQEGDMLQVQAKQAVLDKGLSGIDLVFGAATDRLSSRVQAL